MSFCRTCLSLIALTLAPQVLSAGLWSTPEPKAPPVYVTEAKKQDVQIHYTTLGTLGPGSSAKVVARVDGSIQEVHVKGGEIVEEGQLLVTLSGLKHRVKLEESNAGLQEQEAALEYAQIQFDKSKQLYDTQAISEKEFRLAKERIEVAQAKVAMAQARKTAAELAHNQLEVKASIAGRVGELSRGRGNYVKTNEYLLTIDKVSELDVEFALPERRFQAFREELEAGKLECQIWLPHAKDKVFDADIYFYQNRVNKETGTIGVSASVDNPSHFLWPGQFVKVRLLVQTLKDAVVIPSSSIRRNEEGSYVFVVDQEKKAELRPVKLGPEVDQVRVISEGLEEGETVITEGQLNVWPGIVVDVKDPSEGEGG